MPSEFVVGAGGWPFWLGAIALAAVSVAFALATGALLGVSGSYRRLLGWRAERAREATERTLPSDADALEALLLAETIAEFGADAVAAASAAAPERGASVAPALSGRLPVSAHAVFLAALVLGGALAALSAGAFGTQPQLSDEFSARFRGPWLGPVVLIVGGAMVGFGTSLAGGCTSGHGLSGCGRAQPTSLVATAIFLGVGALVATLIGALT